MLRHIHSPATQEAEAGASQCDVILDDLVRLCLKIKKGWGCSSVLEYLPHMCRALGQSLVP